MKKVLLFLCMVFMSFGLFAVEQKVVIIRALIENYQFQQSAYDRLGKDVDKTVKDMNLRGYEVVQMEHIHDNKHFYGVMLLFQKIAEANEEYMNEMVPVIGEGGKLENIRRGDLNKE